MSHQVTVKTQIKDRDVLEQTLQNLGYTYSQGGRLIDYYNRDAGEVALLVKVGNKSDRVGFRFNEAEQTYDIVGDFFGTGISETTFRNNIKKTYVANKVESLLRKKRYTIVEKKTNNKGAIQICARAMVA